MMEATTSGKPSTSRETSANLSLDLDKKNIQCIKRCHDEAFLYIEQGLTCDEKGQAEQAVTLYTKGLYCIDLACGTPHDGPQCHGQEWQKAKNLVRKMQGTRLQIQTRVESLLESNPHAARSIVDPPPSYDEATSPTNSDSDIALNDILLSDGADMSASATELFKITDGVQIFYISQEGYVSAPSYPSSLAIYKFDESMMPSEASSIPELAQVFLKVGDWTYPLLAGHSPVLHANWGSYIFPDVTSSAEGNSVGVIIPDYVSPADRVRFEEIMTRYTAMREQERSPSDEERRLVASGVQPVLPPGVQPVLPPGVQPVLPPGEWPSEPSLSQERTTSKISRGLETAAEWISWGVIKGAEKTGELVRKGSTKLKNNIQPDQRMAKVDPRTQKGLYYTRVATEGVVKVSGYLVNKLGQGTMFLARKAAPHLRTQSEKYLPQSFTQKDRGGQSKFDGVLEVASGGLKGWSTVYVGLEQAAKVLAKNVTDGTVDVVKHKYGGEAGAATEDAMLAGTNLFLTARYATCLGPTAIAKRVARNTGEVIGEETPGEQPPGGKRSRDDTRAREMDYGDKSTELRDTPATNGEGNMDYGDKSTELRHH